MPARTDHRGVERAAGLIDAVLVAALVALAWWTVVFHVAVPTRWPRDVAGGVWVVGLAAAAAGWWWRARTTGAASVPRERFLPVQVRAPHALVVVVAGVLAAALAATRWADTLPAWWLVWLMVVLTCVAALVLAARGAPVTRAADSPVRDRPDPEQPTTEPQDPSGSPPTSAAQPGSTSHPVARTEAELAAAPRGAPTGTAFSSSRSPSAGAVALVLALALAAAIGSAVTMRADADDVFLVNRSTHVEQHRGPLPERDTIFADEVFAAPRPDTVPTSVEALVGVVAAWSPVTAPTVTYLLFGPAVTALAVLALWRLLRTLGAVAPALATAAGVGFLLLDGAEHAAFGNLHLTRAWQGKVAFLIVVVPLLWHHALRWARDGSRRDLAHVAVGHVAAIGLTSTAGFVAPAVVVVAAAAGSWATGAWRRLGWAALATAPALLAVAAFSVLPRQDPAPAAAVGTGPAPAPSASVVSEGASGAGSAAPVNAAASSPQQAGPPRPHPAVAVPGQFECEPNWPAASTPRCGGPGPVRSLAAEAATARWAWSDPGEGLDPSAEFHRVFGGGVGLFVPFAAVLLAWALVRDRAARAVLALAPLVLFGVFYAPGALEAIGEVTTVRSILWRVAWILPVPAAVGLLVTAPALLARSTARQVAAAAVPTGLAATLLVGSTSALDEANKVRIGWPALDVNPDARIAAETLVELSEPGDVVLSPVPVGGVLATLTTEVRPVNPRTSYMRGRHAVPAFRAPQRLLASEAVTTGAAPEQQADLTDAIRALDVATACVAAGLGNPVVDAALADAGLTPVGEDDRCTYWRRT